MTVIDSEHIKIALTSDTAYLPYAANTILTIIRNTSRSVDIHFLYNDIEFTEIEKLRVICDKNNVAFFPYQISDKELYSLKVDKHASIVNYFRLLLPTIIPNEIEKILYLDSDLIVVGSLDEIWEIDLKNYSIAAIENLDKFCSTNLRLGIPINKKCFNSGVMLCNLKKWRQIQLSEKTLSFIRNNSEIIEFWDQDGLNKILEDDWLEIDMKWNMQHGLFFDSNYALLFKDQLSDPKIIHFTGDGLKPWQIASKHPYTKVFKDSYNQTPWAKTHRLPSERIRISIRIRIKKALNKIVHSFGVILKKLSSNRIIESALYKTISELGFVKINSQQAQNTKLIEKLVLKYSPDLVVLNGPFKGLKYPTLLSIGSTFSPKIFGSYEFELHHLFCSCLFQSFDIVIDIGCAEGYYAVGMAKKNKHARIYAYDTDNLAKELCLKMAQLNDVQDRVEIHDFFDLSKVPSLTSENQGLIISDCEGFEAYIFDVKSTNFSKLSNYHILIEVHEFIEPKVTDYLLNIFAITHKIERILSIDDILKPSYLTHKMPPTFTHDDALIAFAEKRPFGMEWLFLSPFSNSFEC